MMSRHSGEWENRAESIDLARYHLLTTVTSFYCLSYISRSHSRTSMYMCIGPKKHVAKKRDA